MRRSRKSLIPLCAAACLAARRSVISVIIAIINRLFAAAPLPLVHTRLSDGHLLRANARNADALQDNQAREFTVGDSAVFTVKRGDRVYVYRNRCPHLGIELNIQPDEFLDRDGMLIQCANHGALFVVETGECVAGPCLGQSLQALRCKVEDGKLWVAAPAQSG